MLTADTLGAGLRAMAQSFATSMGMVRRMVEFPVSVVSRGLDLLAGSAEQRAADAEKAVAAYAAAMSTEQPETATVSLATSSFAAEQMSNFQPAIPKESKKKMPDQDLSDDLLKTVHYEIKFRMRPYECTFGTRSETIYDNMTNTGYAGWKIAEFVQRLPDMDDSALPHEFIRYLETYGELRRQDMKYFEVWFDVVDREAREDLRYQERQLDYLQQIASKIH